MQIYPQHVILNQFQIDSKNILRMILRIIPILNQFHIDSKYVPGSDSEFQNASNYSPSYKFPILGFLFLKATLFLESLFFI